MPVLIIEKSSRLQPNSRQYKLEERINKKRKEIMERQKDVDEETKTLADEEGDLQDTEDVIKSVKTIMEGKNEKLPSREEFFDTSAQPAAEDIPRSFNQLHLSRPLLRAINELGFSHPTPIQVIARPSPHPRHVASRWRWQAATSALRPRRAAARRRRTFSRCWSVCCEGADAV